MKVKIGNQIIDSEHEPIMLIFENEEERKHLIENLTNMLPDATKYLEYNPDLLTEKGVKQFLNID